MFRGGWLRGIAALLFCLPTFARNADRGISSVSVTVYNDAQVPVATVVRAEETAKKVLQQAGIDVIWNSCGGGSGCESRLSGNYLGAQNLSLRVVTRVKTLSNSVFGVSFLGSDGAGQYGDIFYNTAQTLSEIAHVNLADVLGHVMAHELGHLLLGSNAHSQLGIMKPHWSSEELQRITMGRLLFTPQQAQSMKNKLKDRARLARNLVSD